MRVAAPTIGRLILKPRVAWRHVKAGDFGAVHRGPGCTIFVELEAVEQYVGCRFTEAQLEQ